MGTTFKKIITFFIKSFIIILVTLIYEMIRQNKQKGIATLCIGGGQGIAMCIERI